LDIYSLIYAAHTIECKASSPPMQHVKIEDL
jgi:hypothetical protein